MLWKKLEGIENVGRRRLQYLKRVFLTKEDLMNASAASIAQVDRMSLKLAEKIREVLDGGSPPNRQTRTVMWNKVTKRILRGVCAPLDSEAEAWLRKHSDTYERSTATFLRLFLVQHA